MMKSLHCVILAGGTGTRFWPISRSAKPKQFLSISPSGESLIQATVRRVENLVPQRNFWAVSNGIQEPLIREHVPQCTLIAEPMGRNTAASIGLAALSVKHVDPDGVMLVLPADHSVKNETELLNVLSHAVEVAMERDVLVTIGIAPTSPNTAYGYILRGKPLGDRAFQVTRFFEKPNSERAQQYFESGQYYWNSGMFAWKVGVILKAIEDYLPSLYEGLLRIESLRASQAKNIDEEIRRIFESLESISVDFGILEHARNCAVVSGEPFGWNDVGSWDAWAEHFEKDPDGNLRHGDTLLIDSSNCVVHSNHRLAAVVGADDLVVIDSGDALLVCPRERVQDVKKVVEELKKQGRKELM